MSILLGNVIRMFGWVPLACSFLLSFQEKISWNGITLIVSFFVIVNGVMKHVADPEMAVSLFSLYDNAFLFLILLFRAHGAVGFSHSGILSLVSCLLPGDGAFP